jgi:hypothetical protein
MLLDVGNLWAKSTFDKSAGSKMQKRQLEQDKQHGNEETHAYQRGN